MSLRRRAEECANDCASQYDQCTSGCSVYACIQECEYARSQCMSYCPNCDAWVEVSRALIGRRNSGNSNIPGAQYCHFEEYYLVEQANAAGCYPNRTVCDYDDDTIFDGFGSGYPCESDCCNSDPGDENCCGCDTTTC